VKQPLRQLWHKTNPYWLRGRRRLRRRWQWCRALPDRFLRANWPTDSGSQSGRYRVGIVAVNFNTKEHLSHLLYSIFTKICPHEIARVVIVDNGSTDGSRDLLMQLERAGLIDVILNDRQRYHGPGINQGIRHLGRMTAAATRPDERVDYIWILDSDTVVLRKDVLSNAIRFLQRSNAGVAGEFDYQTPSLPEGYAHVCCLLIDPAQVWRRCIQPFWESGTPAEALQLSARRRGITHVDFGFMRDGYVLHLGGRTLGVIRESRTQRNRYRAWAGQLPGGPGHFHGNPRGPALHQEFIRDYVAAVPDGSASALIAACRGQR
jgi:glycosyltransferase involved in cell wall biosynthesis